MASTRAAIRYAKAILEIAQAKGAADAVNADMIVVEATLSNNAELRTFIGNPTTKVEMKGQVLKLSLGLSGASHVILSDMIARDVDVEASGASHIELNVQKSLRVEASGASKIEYTGNPLNLTKDLSGASVVRRVN
jgi:hypothetical protein